MSLLIIKKVIERMNHQHTNGKDIYPRDIFAMTDLVELQYKTLIDLQYSLELSEVDKSLVVSTITAVDELALERLQAMEI